MIISIKMVNILDGHGNTLTFCNLLYRCISLNVQPNPFHLLWFDSWEDGGISSLTEKQRLP